MKINLLVGGPIENYPEGLLEKRGQDELWVGADKGAVRLLRSRNQTASFNRRLRFINESRTIFGRRHEQGSDDFGS